MGLTGYQNSGQDGLLPGLRRKGLQNSNDYSIGGGNTQAYSDQDRRQNNRGNYQHVQVRSPLPGLPAQLSALSQLDHS